MMVSGLSMAQTGNCASDALRPITKSDALPFRRRLNPVKSFKDVELTRLARNDRPAVNSVHRSSLLVPEIAGSTTEISFLNHFLIKRRYPHVGCRITGVDCNGARVESKLFQVRDPRVYRFNLSELFERKASSYHVEFFAAENLFIPFPAVMINHYGKGFINTVHAFNRVLNDVFEADELNRQGVSESGIPVTVGRSVDTLVWLMSGMYGCKGSAELCLSTSGKSFKAGMPVSMSRFGVAPLSVARTFPQAGDVSMGLLAVSQPDQSMFFGRLLAARVIDGVGFTGNHSYYDTKAAEETFDDARPSSQILGYEANLHPRVRFYPELPSGCVLNLDVIPFDRSGARLAVIACGELHETGLPVEIEVDDRLASAGVDAALVGSYEVRAAPQTGNTPTRIAYHILQGSGACEGATIIGLANPNQRISDPSKGRSWGQLIFGGRFTSALVLAPPRTSEHGTRVKLELFDEKGPVCTREYTIVPNGALTIDPAVEFPELGDAQPETDHRVAWFYVEAEGSGISGYTATSHRSTGLTTIEHTF